MIEIGKAIKSILTSGSTIYNLVGNKIYPLVIPEKTLLPCIVYERNFENEYNNDGYISTSTIDISVLTFDYKESIDLALSIESVLSGFRGVIDNITIIDSKCIGGDETFAQEAYIQKLTFSIRAI